MKRSDNTVRVEAWNVQSKGQRKTVAKVTVRNSKGQFNGATNYRGSVIG